MTQALRDAAQALLDAYDAKTNDVMPHEQVADLRAALSTPQPTADERVAELMRLADEYYFCNGETNSVAEHRAAVEQSARALLSASQEDAEMLDWLVRHVSGSELRRIGVVYPTLDAEYARAAIRSAMKEKKE